MRFINFKYQRFNLGFIRINFGFELCGLVKRWINLNNKIRRNKCRIYFLKQCKLNGVFPMHLSCLNKGKFVLKNYKTKHKLDNLLHNTKTRIVNIEIADLYKQLNNLKKEVLTIVRNLSDTIPIYIWNEIYNTNVRQFDKLNEKLLDSYHKKLTWLIRKNKRDIISKIKEIKYQVHLNKDKNEINYRQNTKDKFKGLDNNVVSVSIDPKKFEYKNLGNWPGTNKKWFINLTNKTIPEEVSNLLQLGEGFSFPFYKNKGKAVFEFIKDIEGRDSCKNSDQRLKIRNTLVTELQRFLDNNQYINNIQKELEYFLKKTKEFCKDNVDIIFTKADKGNMTVALERTYYTENVNLMLKDSTTYEIINKNPVKSVELKLNNILKRWLMMGYISKQESFRLRASDSSLSKAYGLPKIHKKNIPFRIIVSSINSTLHSFAHFLHKILSRSLPLPNSHVTNSFELYKELNGMQVSDNHILISLDVISLFTNVPQELVIDGINNRWQFIEKETKIPKTEFINVIRFVLSSTYFTFDDIIYRQIFGTPMGSPLSPILADIVMQDLELKAINELKIEFPLYYRYVDDIVLLTPDNKVEDILNTFNSIHNRLQFTIEREKNRTLNFLDLTLIISDGIMMLDWYKKDTCSGRYLSYFSGHPLCHKIGTIYGLVDRAILLSHPIFQQKNLEYVVEVLLENSYPLELVLNKIAIRIKELIRRMEIKKPEQKLEPERKMIVFPYIRNISERINSTINKKEYMIGYRILNKLTGFIKRHKDSNSTENNNNAVYKIFCNDCNASYVGQTKRKIQTRIGEHVRNVGVDESRHSVITKHILELNHSMDWKNTKILDIEPNYYKRLISEMIYIKTQDNGLNSVEDIECLDSSYFNILRTITHKHKQLVGTVR